MTTTILHLDEIFQTAEHGAVRVIGFDSDPRANVWVVLVSNPDIDLMVPRSILVH